TLNNLPNVVETFGEVGENMKDVTEVVTEVTADFLVTKDSVKSNMDVIETTSIDIYVQMIKRNITNY
ncbi:hypothetical protein EWL69_19965, partial [Clostridioides difficile]